MNDFSQPRVLSLWLFLMKDLVSDLGELAGVDAVIGNIPPLIESQSAHGGDADAK